MYQETNIQNCVKGYEVVGGFWIDRTSWFLWPQDKPSRFVKREMLLDKLSE